VLHLDKHRPHGRVEGLPGVVWAQDGHFFNGSGRPVTENGTPVAGFEPASPAAVIDAPSSEPVISTVPLPNKTTAAALKKRMEDFGEPWQGAEHARKYLGITE